MTHRRPRSPGSFQDELGGVIERISPPARDAPAKPNKPEKQAVKDTAEINDRLFEKAWRKSD
jgi:hypothetical protein